MPAAAPSASTRRSLSAFDPRRCSGEVLVLGAAVPLMSVSLPINVTEEQEHLTSQASHWSHCIYAWPAYGQDGIQLGRAEPVRQQVAAGAQVPDKRHDGEAAPLQQRA